MYTNIASVQNKKDDFIYNRYYLSTIYFLQLGSIHKERKEGAMHAQLTVRFETYQDRLLSKPSHRAP